MSTFLNVCNDGEELEDISEDIFDRVNIRYTEEYDSYVSRVNQLISPEESILSVGGEHNYNRIITWTNIYNMNSYRNEMEAAQIRAAVNKDTFGIAQCLNDGMMFWNFLKTSESFKSSAWYYREYMLQKLLGSVVHIEEIL